MYKVSAAVIGSGFGGLAVAIRLQAAGCRTVIFEKRDQPGGRAHVYVIRVSPVKRLIKALEFFIWSVANQNRRDKGIGPKQRNGCVGNTSILEEVLNV